VWVGSIVQVIADHLCGRADCGALWRRAVALLDRPRGFNDLQRAIGGANTSTLSQRLEQLTRLGIVDKTVVPTMPPKVRYELTTAGVALQEVIDAIDAWGKRHMPACRERAEGA